MKQVDVLVVGGGRFGIEAAISAADAKKKVLLVTRSGELGGKLNKIIDIYDGNLTGIEYATNLISKLKSLGIEYMTNSNALDLNLLDVCRVNDAGPGQDTQPSTQPEPRHATQPRQDTGPQPSAEPQPTGPAQDMTSTPTPKTATILSARGIEKVMANHIILAAGSHEMSRGALSIPGSRGSGIFMPETIEKLILDGLEVGKSAVILGSNDIALNTARRLSIEGVKVKAIIEEENHIVSENEPLIEQSINDFDIPVFLGWEILEIDGGERIDSVRIAKLDRTKHPIIGTTKTFECDTFVVALGLVADSSLLLKVDVQIDPISGSPILGVKNQTGIKGVFAIGDMTSSSANAHPTSKRILTTVVPIRLRCKVGSEATGEAHGEEVRGEEAQGAEAEGVQPQGVEPQGVQPQGVEPQGVEADGVEPQGMEAETETVIVPIKTTDEVSKSELKALIKSIKQYNYPVYDHISIGDVLIKDIVKGVDVVAAKEFKGGECT
jgi:thioredoxin reductase